jgi:hypothetical protein
LDDRHVRAGLWTATFHMLLAYLPGESFAPAPEGAESRWLANSPVTGDKVDTMRGALSPAFAERVIPSLVGHPRTRFAPRSSPLSTLSWTSTSRTRAVKVAIRVGTDMAVERGTTPTPLRRTCSPRHGLQSWRRDWAGVVKRQRELIFATFTIAAATSLQLSLSHTRTKGVSRPSPWAPLRSTHPGGCCAHSSTHARCR